MTKRSIKILFGISAWALLLYLPVALLQSYNIAALYKDQIEIAEVSPRGYTLEEWSDKLIFWQRFFVISIPVALLLMIYFFYRLARKEKMKS